MLLLISMLAFGQFDGGSDGGSPLDAPLAPIVVLDVVEGTLTVRPEDGGTPLLVEVGDGCYLSTESCIRAGKQKARTSGQLEQSNESGMKWVGIAFAGGALTGVAIGIALGALTPIGKK